MELCPPSVSHELKKFSVILWNPKVYYFVHSNLFLVPITGQINPVHTTSFYYSKIRFNIILQPSSS
jgi:hypothetical protein